MPARAPQQWYDDVAEESLDDESSHADLGPPAEASTDAPSSAKAPHRTTKQRLPEASASAAQQSGGEGSAAPQSGGEAASAPAASTSTVAAAPAASASAVASGQQKKKRVNTDYET